MLGGCANFCLEYATKRYRSNCINWGMIPFTCDEFPAENGQLIYVPGVKKALEEGREEITGYIDADEKKPLKLYMKGLNAAEREILLCGCLMNYYAKRGANHE